MSQLNRRGAPVTCAPVLRSRVRAQISRHPLPRDELAISNIMIGQPTRRLLSLLALCVSAQALGERLSSISPQDERLPSDEADRRLQQANQQQQDVDDPLAQQQEQQEEPAWEYEPRIWTPDDDAEPVAAGRELEELNEILRENQSDQERERPSARATPSRTSSWGRAETRVDPREGVHYWNPRFRRHYGRVDVNPTRKSATFGQRLQASNQTAEACNQFRVDVRETVICDKQRCDKLDFEWPQHDNQLVVMETTKYGMRFHRSEYDFKPPTVATLRNKQQPATADQHKIAPPIKFDLFDLFKPKPTGSPPWAIFLPSTSTTTSEPPTTSTSKRKKSTTPTTIASTTSAYTDATQTEGSSTSMPPLEPTGPEAEPEAETEADTDTEANTESQPTTMATPPSTTPADSSDKSNQSTAAIRDRPQAINGEQQQDFNRTQLITTFRVNSRRRMQTIIGFGGALSDSTCRNIKSLSAAMARSLMEDYFGPRGLRYTIVRMTMGSSDFSTTPYTNNDRPDANTPKVDQANNNNNNNNDDGPDPFDDIRAAHRKVSSATGAAAAPTSLDEGDDVEMKNFRLVDEDYEFKLPVARQAMATSKTKLKFFSSLWSPPIWMKDNNHIVHGYLKGDIYGPYYKALAELMVRWLEAYRKQGIEFWATTGLNEPVTGIQPFIFHNSLGISREDYVTFIKLYLGPMLRQRGFRDIKLIALDDNKGYAHQLARAVLQDKEAAKYVAGIGVHWYMNDEYENLNFLASEFPDKFILSTEACNGYLPFQVHTLPGNWDRGVAYMYDIIKLMHKNIAGWVDWNMALDLYGGPSWAKNNLDAPVIVNADRDEYYKSPMFYAIGHFSRFVEPNSTRLDHRLAYAKYDYPLEAVAYQTPRDYIVIVVLNANHHKVPFRVIVDRQVIKVVDLKADSFSTIIFKWKGASV